jgi:hypothetical protein
MDQAYTSGRRDLLLEYRRNDRVRQLIERGMRDLAASHDAQAALTRP